MRIKVKQFFTSAFAATFIASNVIAPGGGAIVAQAVEQSSLQASAAAQISEGASLVGKFPIGAVLRSDSFPGLSISYNGQTTYTVSKGKNKLSLAVTVTDEKLAKDSVSYLNKIFGPVNIQLKKGVTSFPSCSLNGVFTSEYEGLVKAGKDENLSKFLNAFIEQARKEDSERALYARFYEAVIEAQKDQAGKVENNAEYTLTGIASNSIEADTKEVESENTTEEQDEKKLFTRTILIYLDGTNLETGSAYGTKNILDMLRANIPDNVKVIVVAGGTKTWHMNDKKTYYDYASNLLYPEVDQNKFTPQQKKAVDEKTEELLGKYSTDIKGLQTYEVVNKGGNNSLKLLKTYENQYIVDKDFFISAIDYTTSFAPAEKYDLVIWDHGGGPGGYGDDEFLAEYLEKHPEQKNTIENTVSLKRIKEILEGTAHVKNGGKFDFIGFDACQMGNYEVASTIAPYADFYIGSEENVPGIGWNYSAFFNALGTDPMVSTQDFGNTIVNSFIDQFKNGNSTLSLMDLSKMETLDKKVSEFAFCLMQEADTRYYDIIASVGPKSHFGTREGFGSTNLLDLKRLVSLFTDENKEYSPELVNASNAVIAAIDDCVLANKYKETGVNNGGISIYYPIQAYYERPAEKGMRYYNNKAAELLRIYEENIINKEYKLTAAKLAVRNLAGRRLSIFWDQKENPTVEQLFKDYIDKDKDDKYIVNASGVDRENPDDPIVKTIQKMIDDRISADKVTITMPERKNNDKYGDYNGTAVVKVDNIDPLVAGDKLDVKVYLNIGEGDDTHFVSVGNKNGYSGGKVIQDDGSVTYEALAFDQLWYSLNGQIVSMYVTQVLDDGNFIGYIPFGNWTSEETASGIDAGDKTRTAYMVDQAGKNNLSSIRMYVQSSHAKNEKGEEEWKYTPIRYNDFVEGEEKHSHDMSELDDTYLEILGGADDFYSINETPNTYSLGTVYVEKGKDLSVDCLYAKDLYAEYYLNDVFGDEYYLATDNLNPKGSTEKKGLEEFYDYIPDNECDNAMTWKDSQKEAEKVLKQAVKNVQAERDKANEKTENKIDQVKEEPSGEVAASEEKTGFDTEEAKTAGSETVVEVADIEKEAAVDTIKAEEVSDTAQTDETADTKMEDDTEDAGQEEKTEDTKQEESITDIGAIEADEVNDEADTTDAQEEAVEETQKNDDVADENKTNDEAIIPDEEEN